MPGDEYVTSGEFSRWRTDFNEFQKRLENRLTADHAALSAGIEAISRLQREANGKTAAHAEVIAVMMRDIQAIKDDDREIEKIVASIKDEGCSQYVSHQNVLETVQTLTSDGSLPERPSFRFPRLSRPQKAVAGVGITALLIPAVSDLLKLLESVVHFFIANGGPK